MELTYLDYKVEACLSLICNYLERSILKYKEKTKRRKLIYMKRQISNYKVETCKSISLS